MDFHLYGFDFIVTHLPGSLRTAGKTIRINGHTHEPRVVEKNGSIFINPGSVSLPRGSRQASVAKLIISAPGVAHADILYF